MDIRIDKDELTTILSKWLDDATFSQFRSTEVTGITLGRSVVTVHTTTPAPEVPKIKAVEES